MNHLPFRINGVIHSSVGHFHLSYDFGRSIIWFPKSIEEIPGPSVFKIIHRFSLQSNPEGFGDIWTLGWPPSNCGKWRFSSGSPSLKMFHNPGGDRNPGRGDNPIWTPLLLVKSKRVGVTSRLRRKDPKAVREKTGPFRPQEGWNLSSF